MKALERFRGVIVPAVTPYLEDRSVDYPGVRRIFEYFGSHPAVDGIFVTGATGEFEILDLDERRRILEIAAASKADAFVIPNVSTYLAGGTLELAGFARDLGFDTVGIIIPRDCGTFDEIRGFCERVAGLGVSIFIYQSGSTPHSLSVEELGVLIAKCGIVGLKDSCSPSNMLRHIDYIREYSDRINVIQGVEMLFLCSAVMGGAGVIGGGCNVYPSLLKRVSEAIGNGDVTEARRLQDLVNVLFKVVCEEGAVTESMRYCISLEGVDVGCASRTPGVAVSERKKQLMRELRARIGEA